jgi:hypothetical protein
VDSAVGFTVVIVSLGWDCGEGLRALIRKSFQLVLNLYLIIAFVRRTPHRCPAFTDNVEQIHYTLEMHWRKSFILNFCSTANDNAITEHTDTALCKKLKTTHPHDIVELNNYEKASVDDKNLKCLVTSKQDEISERPRAPCDGTNKNPLQCDICQRTFTLKGNLTKHLLSHTGERPFQCDICQRTFTQKGNLTRHLLSHTGERPFQCDICQRTFTQKVSLTQHIRCHTGERPFQCDICQRTFTQKGNLTQHIRCHTGERPFQCEVEFILDYTDERTLSQQNDAAERMSIELVKWSKERVDAKKGALWYIGGGRNARTSIDNVGMPEILSNSEIFAALRRDNALIRNLNGSKLSTAQIRECIKDGTIEFHVGSINDPNPKVCDKAEEIAQKMLLQTHYASSTIRTIAAGTVCTGNKVDKVSYQVILTWIYSWF